jgi:hypothetical protein
MTIVQADSASTVAAARYAVGVHTVATAIAAELDSERLTGDAAWERAEAALRRHRLGPHAWLFQDPEALVLSPHVLEALEPGPAQPALQGTLGFAAAVVARFDVLSRLAEIREMGSEDDEDAEDDDDAPDAG